MVNLLYPSSESINREENKKNYHNSVKLHKLLDNASVLIFSFIAHHEIIFRI